MEQSPLRLEHYNLQRVSLTPLPGAEPTQLGGYANFGNARLGSKVTTGWLTLDDGEKRHTVELSLTGGPKEPGATFPYEFEISYIGIFDARALPDDKRDDLVMVNGSSMLYGIARETLMGLTIRCELGAMMLPSVVFTELAERRAREAAARLQRAPATPATPAEQAV